MCCWVLYNAVWSSHRTSNRTREKTDRLVLKLTDHLCLTSFRPRLCSHCTQYEEMRWRIILCISVVLWRDISVSVARLVDRTIGMRQSHKGKQNEKKKMKIPANLTVKPSARYNYLIKHGGINIKCRPAYAGMRFHRKHYS